MSELAIASTGRRDFGANAPAVSSGAPTVESLPAPNTDATQDMMAAIFRLLSESNSLRNASTKNQINLNTVKRQQEEERVREATKRAQEAAQDKGIFATLTENIGIVGVVGLATFNYALVAADIGLHASGLVDNLQVDVLDGACVALAQVRPELLAADILLRKLDVAPEAVKQTLEDLGLGTNVPGISDEDVKPVVETAVQLNLLVAGATVSVLSAGTTTALVVALAAVALSTSAFVAQKCEASPWLVMGLAFAGVALSCGTSVAANSGASLGRTASQLAAAKAVGAGVNSVSLGMGGADTIIHAVSEKNVAEANIDAKEARNSLARLQKLLEDLIDVMGETQDSHTRATKAVHTALDTHNKTLLSTTLKA